MRLSCPCPLLLQRCIPLCGQQLESLYGQRETIKAEHAQLADRLKVRGRQSTEQCNSP